MRLNVWDLIGTASYTLAFALLESLLITIPFLVLAVVLPERIFGAHTVVLTAIVVLISSIWMIDANYHQINLAEWNLEHAPRVLFLYLLSIGIPIALVIRFQRLESALLEFVRRLSLLVYLYAALACLGVVIVVFRNL